MTTKALALLEFISNKEEEIGISEINKTLHLGLSTIYRMLAIFKAHGYIIQNQKIMKYRLGIKLFELGYTVQNTNRLIETIKPYFAQLSQSTGETANLAILEGTEIVYIAKIESSEVLTTNIKVGVGLPANCTVLGKISLAFMSKEEGVGLTGNGPGCYGFPYYYSWRFRCFFNRNRCNRYGRRLTYRGDIV